MVNETTILVATTNEGKLREVRTMLAGLPVHIATLREHPGLPEPVEDADTFEGNATLKALHYAKLTGCWALADDSGLEVDALGGQPGIRSARYASSPNGSGGDDAANNAKLIRHLAGVSPEKRTARFCCAMALASGDQVLGTSVGTVEGIIVDEPRGANGFGYDPHFYVPGYGMTTAQMPPEQKNAISHRGKALRAIRPVIERLLAGTG
jgi:XTP/dITP diphosphohydrolase